MKKLSLALLCFFVMLILPATGNAGQPTHYKGSIRTAFDHAFETRIKGLNTRVSSSRYAISGSYSYFTLLYAYTDYSWDKAGDSGLSSTDRTPWTGLHNISLGAAKNFTLSREWMLRAGGGINSAFENEISSSFGGRAHLSLIRLFDNGWTAGIGAAAFHHPVKSRFLPFLDLTYVSAGEQGMSARIGFPETMIRYSFNRHLAVRGYAGYSANIYRLKNSSPVLEKGYFRDRYVRLGMDMEFSPLRSMSFVLGPYYIVERKWEIYDKNHSRRQKERLENTPGIRIELSWNF